MHKLDNHHRCSKFYYNSLCRLKEVLKIIGEMKLLKVVNHLQDSASSQNAGYFEGLVQSLMPKAFQTGEMPKEMNNLDTNPMYA